MAESPIRRAGALDAVAAVEFEAMLLGRHLSLITGRSRRHEGRLDRSAYTLLSRIELGPTSIGELRATTGLDASTLNRQTAAMRAAGLVERVPDPEGGMARKFRITADGQRRLAAERASNVAVMASILGDWSADELATFAVLLGRFNRDIERANGLVWVDLAAEGRRV